MSGQVDGIHFKPRVGQPEAKKVHHLLARIETMHDQNLTESLSLRRVVKVRGLGIRSKNTGVANSGWFGTPSSQHQKGKEERGEPQTHRRRCYTSGPKV